MAGDDTQNHLFSSASSTRRSSEKRSASSKPNSRSRTSSDTDISSIGGVHYPCFGKVDLASYIAARTYGLNFRRLHDEWVVLGRPAINTRHWPVLPGHRGLPASPDDFVAAAEHYEGKIFSQVALDMTGKPADRNRPLDDFIISMVVTAAIVNADFLVHRMVRDEILREEAMVQHVWHRYFTTFLHDAVRHFAHERTVCDRLGTHNCVVPLLYGQACAMTLPTLIQTFDYQVQIFQNLFPNFGDHVNRCAASQPSQRLDVDVIIKEYITKVEGSTRQAMAVGRSASTSGQAGSSGNTQSPYAGTIHPEEDPQAEAGPSRPRLAVTVVPDEVKGRPDLFVSDIDSAIRCDVPLEQVLKVIDSSMTVSAPSSAASTPPPLTAMTSIRAPYHSSSVSSRASFPSSDADWPLRRHADLSDSAVEEGDADIDSANLMLRPPLQGQAQWPVGISRRSTSEEHNAITPDEAMAATQTRTHSNSVYSYFSSLPATPTELLSPDGVVSSQEGAQSYMDRRPYRSNSGLLASTSAALESDTRKRTRAEQNREKMKAYHRRVMQQREALTTVLAEMSAHVGTIPMLSTRTNAAGLLGLFSGEASSSVGGDGASGSASASSVGRSAPESSWSLSLRNKQKQESKARLRKREIDQVYELSLYANYANATLSRPGAAGTSTSPGSRGGSGAPGTGDVQGGMSTAWRQLETAQMAEADAQMTHAILRVFLRHRPSWIALISAEQRLASEVAKLSPRTEDGAGAMDGGSAGDGSPGSGAGKGIKALIDRVQMEERAGTMSMLSLESAHMLSRGMMSGAGVNQPGPLLDASGRPRYASQGSYGASVLLDAGAVVLSPGREYGATASPSGVTRPMGGEEGADYFSQERRALGGRQGDSAAGTQRASGSGHGAMSGMLPAQSGFGYGFYAGEAQVRANAQSPMGGMAAMSPPPLPTQSRMSMSYDGRGGYGATTTTTSRMEQSPGLYHAQSMPMQPYPYAQAPSQPTQMPGGGQGLVQQGPQPMTDAMMAYRSNESAASSYATSHHHHHQHQHQHQQQQQQQHQAQQQHQSQTHTQQPPSYGQQGGYHAQ
ncbi:hypothetical protein PaG_05644 [Moesziomyces aphidis]|uniref:Uncharacterized protein n=1 Tax=Moesziomyces aphidis TaxID=84754 RepID=W3VI06_MOEAP|nr:hypothetical protein PaG_05644 [Moesziomyces aphidis]